MENHFTIETHDDCVYTWIAVKPKFYAYFLLVITLAGVTIPFIFNGFKDVDSVMVSSAFVILWILFPVKYAWWNVFGKETLIINQKSVSYQYHYGFVQSRLISKPYTDLTVYFQDFIISKNDQYGKVCFVSKDETTGLNFNLHITSIYISRNQYDTLVDEILKNHKPDCDYSSN